MKAYRAIKKGKLMPYASDIPIELQEGDVVRHNGEHIATVYRLISFNATMGAINMALNDGTLEEIIDVIRASSLDGINEASVIKSAESKVVYPDLLT